MAIPKRTSFPKRKLDPNAPWNLLSLQTRCREVEDVIREATAERERIEKAIIQLLMPATESLVIDGEDCIGDEGEWYFDLHSVHLHGGGFKVELPNPDDFDHGFQCNEDIPDRIQKIKDPSRRWSAVLRHIGKPFGVTEEGMEVLCDIAFTIAWRHKTAISLQLIDAPNPSPADAA